MDKKKVAHLYNKILCSKKREGTLPGVATWKALETIALSEIAAGTEFLRGGRSFQNTLHIKQEER